MTYLVVSDIHAHLWSQFSKTNPNGVNSRLQIILDELVRSATALKAAGGSVMVIAGDIYHTRGSIDPEVHNPLEATFNQIIDMGIDIHAIPGNHDLKSRETVALSSQVETLGKMFNGANSFKVYNEPTVIETQGHTLAFVPWREQHSSLLHDLEELSKRPNASKMDVFIHAGIDGVLAGNPDSGLTAAVLEAFGFNRVFSGHYHHYKNFNDKVFSIGATAHQSWRDVNTISGFLIVNPTGVSHNLSRAPMFEDISGVTDADEIAALASGNYVRVRGAPMTAKQIEELEAALVGFGALGTSIEVPRASAPAHALAPTSGKPLTLNESLDSYIDKKTEWTPGVDVAKVKARAAQVLIDAQTNHVEA